MSIIYYLDVPSIWSQSLAYNACIFATALFEFRKLKYNINILNHILNLYNYNKLVEGS